MYHLVKKVLRKFDHILVGLFSRESLFIPMVPPEMEIERVTRRELIGLLAYDNAMYDNYNRSARPSTSLKRYSRTKDILKKYSIRALTDLKRRIN